ncbi:hypothetical protein ASE00_02265 [Sphingomonas sp. Root710]|uniref:hypothetical protein n=1 Tax=Sphingomonas sp. Root710 TaxID=1736594 RepID=UPI000701397D|nr:hypothetical protein ASE00_02265 [Sphingomonas sp. Root710]
MRQVYLYIDFRFRDNAQYGSNRLLVNARHQYWAELRLGSGDQSVAEPRMDAAWALGCCFR